MPNLKDIKIRIASVKKTKQITSAMKLVAGAKLRKATEAAVSARPYQRRLTEVLGRVAHSAGDDVADPLLTRREHVGTVLLVVMTSDRGLCGAFNGTLLRRSLEWIRAREAEGKKVAIRVYGRKGKDFLTGRGYPPAEAATDYTRTPKMELVHPLCIGMVAEFEEGHHDEVWLAYNEFRSTISQVPTFARVVPIAIPAGEETTAAPDYRYEPSAPELLGRLLPLYLRTRVLQAFLETEAGFYAAQMTAMDNATRNASELIDRLTLDYNRARQAAITTEITEIVSGAEAL